MHASGKTSRSCVLTCSTPSRDDSIGLGLFVSRRRIACGMAAVASLMTLAAFRSSPA